MAPHSFSMWRHEASYVLLFCLLITLVKPRERNSRYVDAVMTTPKGTLFSMCGMNLAFDRELIGQATYFGLTGHGLQIGGYDDMWTGWCAKVICDHMGWGVNKEARPFFQTVTLSRYLELAKQVKDKLGKVDPNFFKLSDGMVTWTQAWDELDNTPKLKYPKKKILKEKIKPKLLYHQKKLKYLKKIKYYVQYVMCAV